MDGKDLITGHNHYGFEQAFENGLAAHRHGDYQEALNQRFIAFYAEPPTQLDRGRAARDIAATFDRLGRDPKDTGEVTNQVLGEAYAEYAYREHHYIFRGLRHIWDTDFEVDQLTLDCYREFTVSAMYMAVVEARANRGDYAMNYTREAANISWALHERYGKYHQYDVNLSARYSGINAAYFKPQPFKPKLIDSSKKATQLAKMSETEAVLGYNPRLTPKEVKQAQRKAKVRALAATALIGMAKLPTRNVTRPLAMKILNKVVL